jgi:hypothetical protein
MEWPLGWMWASTITAAAALIAPWFLPRPKRQLSLLVLVAAFVTYAVYESTVQALARDGDALIRVDLFWLLPLLAAGTLSCVGATINSRRA